MSRAASSVASSSSAASAFAADENADDAAQSLAAASPSERRSEMSATQPHLLSTSSSRSTIAMYAKKGTQPADATLMPLPKSTPSEARRRPRAPSVASSSTSTTTSLISRPRRQRRTDAQVLSSPEKPPRSGLRNSNSRNSSGSSFPAERQRPSTAASSPFSPQASRASSMVSKASTSLTVPTSTAAVDPPAHQPLPPMTRTFLSTGVFEVMLNHARVCVDRRYPFLDPTSLFTAHAAASAASSGEAAASDVMPPLHRYGCRPILLLDYTGTLHLRHQRRARQAAIKDEVSKLLAERADQIRTARYWRMRRLRACRGSGALLTVSPPRRGVRNEEEVDGAAVDEQGGATQRKSPPTRPRDVPRTAADVDRLIAATGTRRAAITRQLQALREERVQLAQAKHRSAATLEGCVLMLPSPGTHEVRLCSGHHYRTVCFVGEQLMDIVPGEGPVPRPNASLPAPAPVRSVSTATPSTGALAQAEANTNDRTQVEGSQLRMPAWAKAELSGLDIFRRVHSRKRLPTRRSPVGVAGDEMVDGHDSSTAASAMIDAYLALSACEAAMYREWAIQKNGLQ